MPGEMVRLFKLKHKVSQCGAEFHTTIDVMKERPGDVFCLVCPPRVDEDRNAAVRRLGDAITEYLEAQEDLEKRFKLVLINDAK